MEPLRTPNALPSPASAPPSCIGIEQSPSHVSVRFADNRLPALSLTQTRSASDIAPLFAESWGDVVWSDAVTLTCDYLIANASVVRGLDVIELGACHGVPGMVASLLGASKVLVTDLHADAARRALHENATALQRGNISAMDLDWGGGAPLGAFDVIVAVECVSIDVYGRASLDKLARQCALCSKPGARLILCSRRRSGDGLDVLLAALASMQWRCQQPSLVTAQGVELHTLSLCTSMANLDTNGSRVAPPQGLHI